MKKSDTQTIITALRILSNEIHSDDGVANAVCAEAAERLEELSLSQVLLNFDEAAEILRVSRLTIYRWLKPSHDNYDPSFPRPVKMGHKTFFKRQSIINWVASLPEMESEMEES